MINKNKTNHPISSNSHPTATANIANTLPQNGEGYKTNGIIIVLRQKNVKT